MKSSHREESANRSEISSGDSRRTVVRAEVTNEGCGDRETEEAHDWMSANCGQAAFHGGIKLERINKLSTGFVVPSRRRRIPAFRFQLVCNLFRNTLSHSDFLCKVCVCCWMSQQ